MELKTMYTKVKDFIIKNKYIALIIVLGLILMLVPSKSDSRPTTNVNENSLVQQQEISIEKRLSEILKQIDGAGNVEVMLTIAKGEETIYQSDSNTTVDSDSSRQDISTVTITDSNKEQSGLVRQKVSPVYLGAIVICQGADNPNVRLAITDAVAKITGLKSNHISVVKMK